jgi:hypothetical protein
MMMKMRRRMLLLWLSPASAALRDDMTATQVHRLSFSSELQERTENRQRSGATQSTS